MRIPGWIPCASSRSSSTRDLELVGRRREQPVELRVSVAVQLALRAPQLERERDEALLRAVVEIALDAPPLLVRGR